MKSEKDDSGSKKILRKKAMNREEVQYFLDLYKSYECLWNVNHEDYKNLQVRRSSWIEIAQEMDATVEYCKTKIKNLRHVYLGEKKRIESNLQADPYASSESNLFYFNNLSFLDEVLSYRPHDETIESKTGEGENDKPSNLKNRRMSMYLPEPIEPDFLKEEEENDDDTSENVTKAIESLNDETRGRSPPTKKVKVNEKSPKKLKMNSKTVEMAMEDCGEALSNGHEQDDENQIYAKKDNLIIAKCKKNLNSPMKNNVTTEIPIKNLNKQHTEDTVGLPQENGEKTKVKSKKKSKRSHEDSISEVEIPHVNNVQSTTSALNPPESLPEKQRKISSNSIEEDSETTKKEKRNRKNSIVQEINGDVFLAYGKSIALQLMQLPLKSSINAMADIQTLVANRMIISLTEETEPPKKSVQF